VWFFSKQNYYKNKWLVQKNVIYKHERNWTIWPNVWKPYATKEKMLKKSLIIHVCQQVDECASYEK